MIARSSRDGARPDEATADRTVSASFASLNCRGGILTETGQRSVLGCCIARRRSQHPFADRRHPAYCLGQRYETGRGHRRSVRTGPPKQSFEARHGCGRKVDLRLVDKTEHLKRKALSKPRRASTASFMHGSKKSMTAAAAPFGRIERQIGVRDVSETSEPASPMATPRLAQTFTERPSMMYVRDKRSTRRRAMLSGDILSNSACIPTNSSPSKRATRPSSAHSFIRRAPTSRTAGPRRMAERIVDELEPVEVDVVDGISIRPDRLAAEMLPSRRIDIWS